MKYTRSKDGVDRVTLWASIRLTREGLAEVREMAKRTDLPLKQFLAKCLQAGLASEAEAMDAEIEYEKALRERSLG